MGAKELIVSGQTALGIELGSTRIKAVLTDYSGQVLAVGTYDWENSLVDGVWTYSYEEIDAGVKGCYASLRADVEEKYGVVPETYGAMGISAMMHGYIALDAQGNPLAPFQTWRNTNTQAAADELTELFDFNIPLRWTVSHLYQRMLDGEAHLKDVCYVTTLAGYIHWKLTGEKVVSVGDASGIFPIDSETMDYDAAMMDKFEALISRFGFGWKAKDVLPGVLTAGENAGTLTEQGAAYLDETGTLKSGVILCPPEGDAGTGMVATNSVAVGTGNVSAGTSTFAMIVMDKRLSKVYREIDMVTTPSGFPVAMSHANNGTSDLNAWVGLFREFATLMDMDVDMGTLYGKLYNHAMTGDPDCGGLMSYGYYSGENVTRINAGRLAFLRMPGSKFTLANMMRAHLYTSLGAVKMGLDILMKEEGAKVEKIMGHGGFFKTKGVGQACLAAAVNAPVTVMDTAGEGGAWGIALLAAYLADKKEGETLEAYLDERIFSNMSGTTLEPDPEDVKGFEAFMDHYRAALPVERAAVESMNWE